MSNFNSRPVNLLRYTAMPYPTKLAAIGHVTRSPRTIATAITKIGGCPVLFEEIDWPECDACGEEMDFIAQLKLDHPVALSSEFTMAYAFMCSEIECGSYDPMSGASQVILQSDSGSSFVGTRTEVPDFGSYPDYQIGFAHATEPEIPTADFRGDPALRKLVSKETKIGGVPLWIQSNDWPACPDCGGQTKFAAQIRSELDGPLPANPALRDDHQCLNFGDAGTAYIFICEEHCSGYGGALVWQCY